MALIQCPECHKEVSDTAPQCVNCGYQMKTQAPAGNQQKTMSKFHVLGIVIVALLVIGVFGWQQNQEYTYRTSIHAMLSVIASDTSSAIDQYIQVEQLRSDTEASGELFYPALERFNTRTSIKSQREALIERTRAIEAQFDALSVPMKYREAHETMAVLVRIYANFVREACSDGNDGYELSARFSAESITSLMQKVDDAIPAVES